MNKLVKQQNSVGIQVINPQQIRNVSTSQVSIYNASLVNKKFKEYSTEKDLLLMNALITKWAKYIGAKQPEALDLNTIANYIKESFPNFNDVDLNEMINLLVNGRLETDAEAYGSLSVMYCSKVLHAYQDYKFKVLFRVREELQKMENEKPKVINKEERLKNFKDLLVHAEETTKTETYVDAGDIIYGFIRKNKLMSIPKEMSDSAIEYGKKRFSDEKKKKYMEATIKHHSYKTLSDLNFEEEDKVKKYAREYVVNIWLKEFDVSKIIEKITYSMIDY
jgi:hypothetical protein